MQCYFLLFGPKVYSLMGFSDSPSNMTRPAVQWTAEQETGRNKEGLWEGEDEDEGEEEKGCV